MDERMTRGWWRRNALPLGLIVVLAPVTAAAISLNAWQDLDSVHRTAVAVGDDVAYGGADVGPVRARFDALEGIPRGSRVVAVEIDVDPHGAAYPCSAPKLIETGGKHREWQDATLSLDRPYDPDRVTYCDSELTAPFTLSFDYLVPGDASGPFELEFASSNAVPDVLRLAIAP